MVKGLVNCPKGALAELLEDLEPFVVIIEIIETCKHLDNFLN